jgi:hypothetical protein
LAGINVQKSPKATVGDGKMKDLQLTLALAAISLLIIELFIIKDHE